MILTIFIFSFLLCSNSKSLIQDMYTSKDWNRIKVLENKNIYESDSYINNIKYIKIEQEVKKNPESILNTIQSIENWNDIISNKNIKTSLLLNVEDTLVVLQKISNVIPFTKNRVYIFKLFKVNSNRIDWYLTSDYNNLLDNFLEDDDYKLSLGAGSWEIKNDSHEKKLIYRLYLDDEVNLSSMLIQKLRVNYAIDIFDDMLTYKIGEK